MQEILLFILLQAVAQVQHDAEPPREPHYFSRELCALSMAQDMQSIVCICNTKHSWVTSLYISPFIRHPIAVRQMKPNAGMCLPGGGLVLFALEGQWNGVLTPRTLDTFVLP